MAFIKNRDRELRVSQKGVYAPGDFIEPRKHEVELAKVYLAKLPRSKVPQVGSYGTKHRCEDWAKTYISNGAVILAASELGIDFDWRGGLNVNLCLAKATL